MSFLDCAVAASFKCNVISAWRLLLSGDDEIVVMAASSSVGDIIGSDADEMTANSGDADDVVRSFAVLGGGVIN